MKKKKEKIKESEDVGHCGGALGGGGAGVSLLPVWRGAMKDKQRGAA